MVAFRSLLVAAVAAVAYGAPAKDCPPAGTAPPNSIPIAVGGKEASISEDVIRLMLPEYDVVHVINSAPVGRSEFKALLNGEITIPVTMLGSNFNNPNPRIPEAVFIGGGFAQSEIEEMYAPRVMKSVPWLYPPTMGRANGTVVPPTPFIVGRVKQVFAEHGLVPGSNETYPRGTVWSF